MANIKKKLWQKTSSSSPVWAMLLSLLLKTIYKTISPSVGMSVHSSGGCLVFVLLAFECATLQQLCNLLSWIFSLKILFLLLADFVVATKEKDRLYKRQLIIVIPGISSGNIYHLDMKEKIRCSDCIWCRFVRLQNYLWDTIYFLWFRKIRIREKKLLYLSWVKNTKIYVNIRLRNREYLCTEKTNATYKKWLEVTVQI